MRKCVFGHMRTAKTQISLRICAMWSWPSLSANGIIGYYSMFQRGQIPIWDYASILILCACSKALFRFMQPIWPCNQGHRGNGLYWTWTVSNRSPSINLSHRDNRSTWFLLLEQLVYCCCGRQTSPCTLLWFSLYLLVLCDHWAYFVNFEKLYESHWCGIIGWN